MNIQQPVSIDDITVHMLRQDEADVHLKKAFESSQFSGDIRISFQEEFSQDNISALPPNRRLYFLACASSSDELIAGIDSHTVNLSSFCKINTKEESLARGRDCVRKLIEQVIVPKCRESRKDHFSAMPATLRSLKLFEYLMAPENLPFGISRIEYTHPTVLIKVTI